MELHNIKEIAVGGNDLISGVEKWKGERITKNATELRPAKAQDEFARE